jgi:hypothetical protein
MIMSQEKALFKAKKKFEQMEAAVRQAALEGQRIDLFERDLWDQMLQLGHQMLQAYVDLQGNGDLGSTFEYEGRTLNRLDTVHDRRYVSVFGELLISRVVYGTRETQKHEVVPLDAILGLPDSNFSYLLQQWDQSFCVQGSYAQSKQNVEDILNLGQSVRSLEAMNQSMAKDVESFRDAEPSPPPEEEGEILVLTADGKGVPMRQEKSQDAPVKRRRRKKGEKANKKRMACVGAVYTIDPFVRTAEEIVDEVLRKQCREVRPSPQNKKLRAELTRPIDGIETGAKERIFSWFQDEAAHRNPQDQKTVVCVMDGERALWKKLQEYDLDVVTILDIFHALERIWTAAHCFHPEGSDQAEEFVTVRLQRILEGGVGRVIGGLKQMATKRNLRGSRLQRLNASVKYLTNNRKHMCYDEYLANGYPIGSGVVEGACRHLVKDRMELTGMRWRTEGAQAMLDLRSVFLNGDWERFQQHRIEEKTCELYPYGELVMSIAKKAA